jgi:DNA-binding Lrp family transcriptional regulator
LLLEILDIFAPLSTSVIVLPDLDDVDKKILKKLQEDARISFKEIAKEVGTSEATVFVRVKKLQKSGVIKGFRAILNPPSVGKQVTAFALVKAEPKSYPRMLAQLMNLEDICEIHDVTGAYYSILKMRTTTSEQLAEILDKIGEIEGIAGTETVIVLRTIKEETSIRL